MFRILLIDDTKSVHAYVKFILSKSPDIVTESVFDGSEGIKRLKKSKDFDLICLDWEMPILTGPETLKQMSQMGSTIPVLMMTSKNALEDISLVLSLGAAEYVMKPFTPAILFEKIEQITGKAFSHAG